MNLSLAEDIPLEVCYIEFPVGMFTEGLDKLLHYFELKRTKEEVLKDQQWCAKKISNVISCQAPLNGSYCSDLLICLTSRHDTFYFKDVKLRVSELKTLVDKRWYSDAILINLCNILNTAVSTSLAVYFNNFIKSPHLPKSRSPDSYPHVLVVPVNVGGSANQTVFGGSLLKDGTVNRGSHFALAVYYSSSKECFYADTLGWPWPSNFKTSFLNLVNRVYNRQSASSMNINFKYCHQPYHMLVPEDHSCSGKCSGKCSKLYPLQSCQSIVGPVVEA